MPDIKFGRGLVIRSGAVLGFYVTAACAPRVQPAPVAPEATMWPDPAFVPERQCHGRYAIQDLERYLPRARLAMSLPGTQTVTFDPTRRCITVRVESVGSGRLAELVLRGVSVPRKAVLLQLGL
jgi:hypothetical protein